MRIQSQRDTFAVRLAGNPFADFTAWAIQNHRPMDTQSLGMFVQAEGLPAQVYRDLEAFMGGVRWAD